MEKHESFLPNGDGVVRKERCLVIFVFLAGALVCCSPWAFAEGLVIRGGSALTLNDGTLDLSCRDLTIEDFGTLDLGTGTVRQCGDLLVLPGGLFISDTGTIYYCGVMPYVPLLLLFEEQEAAPRRR